MTGDLIAFIRAQLDEEERMARAAARGGRWHYSGEGTVGEWTLYDEHWSIATMTTYDVQSYDYSERMPAARHPGYIDPHANGEHIERWDPAHVLAEVEAKRRILDACEHYLHDDDRGTDPCAGTVLALLGLPYADRPGYREEWRP